MSKRTAASAWARTDRQAGSCLPLSSGLFRHTHPYAPAIGGVLAAKESKSPNLGDLADGNDADCVKVEHSYGARIAHVRRDVYPLE